jgi:cytochrome c oxidase assembly protein subunit 15
VTALYDLSPLGQMLLMVLVLVAAPIAWIWRRHADPLARRRALAIFLLFLTFDLVVFGAFTRLTDSGLGCPDWPGCYGSGTPVGARAHIEQAQAAMPTGPVTHSKAWIEMIHRYLASAVGALILVLTVLAWRRPVPGVSPWLPTATLVWVCLQGAFGALTVTMKLFPAIVTLHLLGGIGLLLLLVLQVARQSPPQWPVLSAGLRRWLQAVLVLLMLQITLGGWVSTNYAVLACQEFPMCQGQWWPPMNFQQGFEVWRALGVDTHGAPISFAALTAIHYVHRLMAYVVLALLAFTVWRLARDNHGPGARRLAWLSALQLVTGLSNVVLDWPLVAALLHTAGAAALAMQLVWLLSHRFAAPVSAASGEVAALSKGKPA